MWSLEEDVLIDWQRGLRQRLCLKHENVKRGFATKLLNLQREAYRTITLND